MAQIFISYKRSDLKKVSQVVDEIKKRTGVDCWIDLEGIESGDQFQKVIINAINSADIVVAMLSRDFIKSYTDPKTGLENPEKQSFTEKEVMYALRHDKRVVPLSIDGTTIRDCEWLDFNCSGIDSIEWKVEEQREKFFSNVCRWLNVDIPEDDTPNPNAFKRIWNWIKRHVFAFVGLFLVLCFLCVLAYWYPFIVNKDNGEPPRTSVADHTDAQAVDLGLPSGTLWADRNIGATSINDYGDLYAWGEIAPKSSYYQNDYKDPGVNNLCGSSYDVATVMLGKGWQMPSKKQFDELKNNCSWKWTARDSTCGYEITGKNGNKIYLPACGWNRQTDIEYRGRYGYYWTGERYESMPQFAYGILFSRSDFKIGHVYLYFGRGVRAVTR